MNEQQKRVYREMKKYSLAEIERAQLPLPPLEENEPSFEDQRSISADPVAGPMPATASADIVLTQLLRLQQIACGFVVDDDGQERDLWDSENPRVRGMLDAIEETSGKVIIWAPFRRSIDEIVAALSEEYGPESVVRYDGLVTKSDDLEAAKRGFQDSASPVRFFVGNPQKGGRGLTLTAASLMLYFANTYDNEIREQSEDRAHRDGLDHSVSYQDLRSRGTVDDKVSEALRGKKNVAAMLRDGSWRDLFRED